MHSLSPHSAPPPAAVAGPLRPLERAAARAGGRRARAGPGSGPDWLLAGVAWGRSLLRLGRPLLPGGAAAWSGLEARLEAFGEFQAGRSAAAQAGGGGLATAVERAASAGAFRGLWRAEGAGYAWGEGRGWDGEAARDELASVPPGAWLPVHSGLGLALAAATVGGELRRGALRRLVDEHWQRAQELALPGFAAAVAEGLGLAVRAIRPSLLDEVAIALPGDGDDRSDLFWHGVGRALVFVPSAAFAAAPDGAALDEALAAPAGAPRDNALAGVAWAGTLIDVARPAAVRRRFRAAAERLPDVEPFAHGVVSALVLWSRWAGRGGWSDAADDDGAWRRSVATPLGAALDGWTGDADTLFRFRTFAELGWRREEAA